MKIKPCPFCGNTTELDIQHGTEDREGIPINIMCGVCGACGPWECISPDFKLLEDVETVAKITGWNERKGG